MFWTNYERYCKAIGKSPNAVAQAVGIGSSGSVSGWKSGATPRQAVIHNLVKYFNNNGLSITAADLMADSDSDEIAVRELLRNRAECKVLFDAAKDAPASALLQAAALILKLKEDALEK